MNTQEVLIRHTQPSQWGFIESGKGCADVLFVPLKGLTARSAIEIETDGNMINVLPGHGAIVESNKWGVTKSVGPCSIAVITGMDNAVWLGHLKPGRGLPSGSLRAITHRKFSHTHLNITLIGANPTGFSSLEDAQRSRELQVFTIQKQTEAIGVRSNMFTHWNMRGTEWLVAFVHAYKNCAEIYIAPELP